MLKPNSKIYLSTQTETLKREKMLQLIKSAFFEKWILSFETVNSTFYA